MHAEQLARVATDPILRLAEERGLVGLELHIDDPSLVPLQKCGVQENRDASRTAAVCGPTDAAVASLSFNDAIPVDWNASVLGVRSRKSSWANGLMGTLLVWCASRLSSLKLEDVNVDFYGASLILSPSIRDKLLVPNSVTATMAPSGHCVVHDIDEDPSALFQIRACSRFVWSLRAQRVEHQGASKWFVTLRDADEKRCEHGESETRMQYSLSSCLRRMTVEQRARTTVVQISRDSDNVCLSLLGASLHHFGDPCNIFVRIGHKYHDIRKLLFAIEHHDLSPLAIARLYCYGGNDFNAACNVASNKAMVRTYCAFSKEIGALDTPQSCRALYYYTFCSVLAVGSSRNMPLELSGLAAMTPAWCAAVQSYVMFHKKTTTASFLLPQDADIELAFRRASLFTIDSYWQGAAVTRRLVNLPLGESVGTNMEGAMVLETAASVTERKELIKFRSSTCGCGRSTNNMCCLPSSTMSSAKSRCGCSRAQKMCSANCRCDPIRCANRLGGIEGAKQRILTSVAESEPSHSTSGQRWSIADMVLPENAPAATTDGGLSSPSDSESETSSISDPIAGSNSASDRSEIIDLTGLNYFSSDDERNEEEDYFSS